MRTITTTVYHYDELPTEKAKEAARDWWRECEAQDPGWIGEHEQSGRAALRFIRDHARDIADGDGNGVASLILAVRALRAAPDKCCPWTGYCADEIAVDAILESGDAEDLREVSQRVEEAMNQAWKAEQEANMEDENVAESIRINDYEFTEYGENV